MALGTMLHTSHSFTIALAMNRKFISLCQYRMVSNTQSAGLSNVTCWKI